jgi:hypothetical protein
VSTVHLALGGSAAGNVRELIKNRLSERLIRVDDIYSIGPLFNIHEERGLRARKDYLRKIFLTINEGSHFETFIPHIGLVGILRIPKDASRIVVWCGANADEQTILRAVCANLPETPLIIVDIDTSSPPACQRVAIGGCNLEELAKAEEKAVVLSADARERLAAEWRNLISEQHLLRIYSGGCVKGVSETFFDERLVDLCPEHFGSAARLVGSVMGRSEIQIGDTFLDYRLRALIAHGVIEALDVEKQLRFVQVRRARKNP